MLSLSRTTWSRRCDPMVLGTAKLKHRESTISPTTRGRDAAKELTAKKNITKEFAIVFLRDQVYRELQLQIGWTEQKSIDMDKLAQEDHSYRLSKEEFKKCQRQWYLTLNKSGKNAPMRLRSDFRAAVTIKNRLHRESGEERAEPISPQQYRRWHASSSSDSGWNWDQKLVELMRNHFL